LDKGRDFWVTENKNRRVPDVYTTEEWYKLVEAASEKKIFKVIWMKEQGLFQWQKYNRNPCFTVQ
jgi:hypothetical protein